MGYKKQIGHNVSYGTRGRICTVKEMDRRQQKTREAIFGAFRRLLERKSYHRITVQDIIEEANIGRSTFYAHFETRDELLGAMCRQIFDHIFSDVLKAEENHDFSGGNRTLAEKLTHLLYHLKEQKQDILHILGGESSDLFLGYFRNCLTELFAEYKKGSFPEIPDDFVLNHYAGSFSEAVKWWAGRDMACEPEKVVEYYGTLTKSLTPSREAGSPG